MSNVMVKNVVYSMILISKKSGDCERDGSSDSDKREIKKKEISGKGERRKEEREEKRKKREE